MLSRIRLLAVVGGNEVTNPFVVTEAYIRRDGAWQLASLSFTRLLEPGEEPPGARPAGPRPGGGGAAAGGAGPSSAGPQVMGGVAPKLAALTNKVLYHDVWARPQLSPGDRSLAAVAALLAKNRPGQLRSHLRIARRNGLSQDELIEVITHFAFYAGAPSTVTAVGVAREVCQSSPQR